MKKNLVMAIGVVLLAIIAYQVWQMNHRPQSFAERQEAYNQCIRDANYAASAVQGCRDQYLR